MVIGGCGVCRGWGLYVDTAFISWAPGAFVRGDRGHSIPGAPDCWADILPLIDTIHSNTHYL